MLNIKIFLYSYNQFLLNKSCNNLVKYLNIIKVKYSGPIFFPRKKILINLLKSPHIDKNSRDQIFFEKYKFLIYIYNINKNIIKKINKFNLPSLIKVKFLFYK